MTLAFYSAADIGVIVAAAISAGVMSIGAVTIQILTFLRQSKQNAVVADVKQQAAEIESKHAGLADRVRHVESKAGIVPPDTVLTKGIRAQHHDHKAQR